jgi:hypothetical protein
MAVLDMAPPARKKPINWSLITRVGALAVVVLGALGYVLWNFTEMAITHGIKDVGGGYSEVDLKAMSVFDFDQNNGTVNDVPKMWREMDGKKVVCFGEMWDARNAGRFVGQFQLCYSIAKCCFNGPPQVQHFVQCTPVANANLEYISGLVKVKGTLHVNVTRDETKVSHVYWMDVESIEPG